MARNSRRFVPLGRRRTFATDDALISDLYARNHELSLRLSELSRQRDAAVEDNIAYKRDLRIQKRVTGDADAKLAQLERNYRKVLARVRELEGDPVPVVWNSFDEQYECGSCCWCLDGYDEPNYCPNCGTRADWVHQEPKGIEYADWALDAMKDERLGS